MIILSLNSHDVINSVPGRSIFMMMTMACIVSIYMVTMVPSPMSSMVTSVMAVITITPTRPVSTRVVPIILPCINTMPVVSPAMSTCRMRVSRHMVIVKGYGIDATGASYAIPMTSTNNKTIHQIRRAS